MASLYELTKQQCVGFFTQTCKTKQCYKSFLLRDCKEVNISMSFQKVWLGCKFSLIINRSRGEGS